MGQRPGKYFLALYIGSSRSAAPSRMIYGPAVLRATVCPSKCGNVSDGFKANGVIVRKSIILLASGRCRRPHFFSFSGERFRFVQNPKHVKNRKTFSAFYDLQHFFFFEKMIWEGPRCVVSSKIMFWEGFKVWEGPQGHLFVILKKIINNVNVSETERYKAQLKLQKLPRNSLSTRIKNRCILTGRTHAIVGPFNLSRVKLRDLISNGKITGFKKSVW